MTNYQDTGDQSGSGLPPQQAGYPASQGGPPQGGPAYQETSQFPPSGQQQWTGGQGSHGNPVHHRPSFNVKSALKTTEFWVLVVVSVALLIAAAVTDQGDDGQGFGSQDAWMFITILGAAYMISRGLTKFGGRDEKDHHSSSYR